MKLSLNIAKLKQFVRIRILHANDSPHRLAMGAAIGLFTGWTPALGLHILIAFILAAIFRANKLLAVALVWVSNPLTLVPIYYPSYLVGSKIVAFFRPDSVGTNQRVSELLGKIKTEGWMFGIVHKEFWDHLFKLLWHGSIELWVGSIFVGVLAAIAGYVATYHLVSWYRKANPRRRYLPLD